MIPPYARYFTSTLHGFVNVIAGRNTPRRIVRSNGSAVVADKILEPLGQLPRGHQLGPMSEPFRQRAGTSEQIQLAGHAHQVMALAGSGNAAATVTAAQRSAKQWSGRNVQARKKADGTPFRSTPEQRQQDDDRQRHAEQPK
jgi:hypothetical protein